jgi:hypothetical protein
MAHACGTGEQARRVRLRHRRWLAASVAIFIQSAAVASAGTLTSFEDERQAFRRSLASLLLAERFDELESRAAALRRQKTRFSSGAPMLFDFYEGLNPATGHVPRDQRQNHHVRLEKWQAQRPKSVTPRIPLIREEATLGWESRGEGSASTVTAEGRQGFQSHGEKAWSLGQQALLVDVTDPALYDILLSLSVSSNRPRPELEAVFDKGIALDPGFEHLYVLMARYLMPRWHGTPEDFARFADRAAATTKATLGDGMYARVAAEGLLLYGGGDFTALAPSLPWPRLKQGFLDLDKAFPDSSLIVNAFCYLALRYGDVETARGLFRRIGDHWSEDSTKVWGNRARFDALRARVAAPQPTGP